MDLATVQSRLAAGHYGGSKGRGAFSADVDRIFDNCMLYNGEDSDVYRDALTLQGEKAGMGQAECCDSSQRFASRAGSVQGGKGLRWRHIYGERLMLHIVHGSRTLTRLVGYKWPIYGAFLLPSPSFGYHSPRHTLPNPVPSHLHSRTHRHTHTFMHTHIQSQTHKQTQTHANTHAHTCAFTHNLRGAALLRKWKPLIARQRPTKKVRTAVSAVAANGKAGGTPLRRALPRAVAHAGEEQGREGEDAMTLRKSRASAVSAQTRIASQVAPSPRAARLTPSQHTPRAGRR